MNFEIIHNSYVNELVETVCLTFLHSLWQGLAAAVLTGFFLMLTKKSRPAFRYNTLVAMLAMLLLVNLATFLLLLPETHSEIRGSVWLPAGQLETVVGLQVESSTVGGSIVEPVIAFCTNHAAAILTIWLLVFLWKSFRAAAGLVYLRKLRTNGIFAPSNYWKDVFADLSRKLRISRRIHFYESAHVSVPMVIGYVKPVVLVPLGMLAGLPAAQVEAILLHELAHIRRRDYLINLVQIFCENVYFFNPAILWISYLIREEREHCCDDLAIGVTENKTSFIHALVSFQEYSLSVGGAQIAFAGKKNHLLGRIKRIINHNNKSLDAMEKVFVSISLVAAIALSAAISPQNPENSQATASPDRQRIYSQPDPAPVARAEVRPVVDTLPKKKQEQSTTIHSASVYSERQGLSSYDVEVDGKRYEIVKKDGKILSLEVDGKEIPASDYAKYQDTIDQIDQKVKAAHEEAEKQRAKAEVARAEASVHRKEAEKMRLEAEKARAHADEQRQHAHMQRQEAAQMRELAEQGRKQAEAMREQAEQLRKEADKLRAHAEKSREEAEVMRKEAEKTREEYEKKQAALIDDLLQAGIIRNTKDLSFRLTADELEVNGIRQPADLHKRMNAKYLNGEPAEMVYNYKGRTGYTISGKIHTK